jgi:hypothetical protein
MYAASHDSSDITFAASSGAFLIFASEMYAHEAPHDASILSQKAAEIFVCPYYCLLIRHIKGECSKRPESK